MLIPQSFISKSKKFKRIKYLHREKTQTLHLKKIKIKRMKKKNTIIQLTSTNENFPPKCTTLTTKLKANNPGKDIVQHPGNIIQGSFL